MFGLHKLSIFKATQAELQSQSINGLDRTDINADLSKMVYYITCSIGLLVV